MTARSSITDEDDAVPRLDLVNLLGAGHVNMHVGDLAAMRSSLAKGTMLLMTSREPHLSVYNPCPRSSLASRTPRSIARMQRMGPVETIRHSARYHLRFLVFTTAGVSPRGRVYLRLVIGLSPDLRRWTSTSRQGQSDQYSPETVLARRGGYTTWRRPTRQCPQSIHVCPFQTCHYDYDYD